MALASASRTIGAACPSTSGPHERTKSMYSLPSASQIRAPSPLAATTGSPPTPRKARTGEFTPPGKSSRARAIISADRTLAAVAADRHLLDGKLARDTLHSRDSSRHGDANHRRLKVLVVDDFFDSHLGYGARRQRFIQLCHPIDIVGLPRKARLRCPAGNIGAVHKSHRSAPGSRFVPLRCDRALKLGQSLQPLALHRLVHVV